MLAKARAIAQGYRLVISPEPSVGYFGHSLEMPLVMGEGKTIAACAADVLEATIAAVATMIERGERPPMAQGEPKRDQQVNIRLSSEEKLRLEGLSRRGGFSTLSDYVREAALRESA